MFSAYVNNNLDKYIHEAENDQSDAAYYTRNRKLGRTKDYQNKATRVMDNIRVQINKADYRLTYILLYYHKWYTATN